MTPAMTALDCLRWSWCPIILYGGHKTGDASKRPIGENWQAQRHTTDSIRKAFFAKPKAWTGALLGSDGSGVCDVEIDTADGEQSFAEMFGSIVTPTFRSTRGKHRIFRACERLDAAIPKAKIDFRGVEFRLGAGGHAAQTVLPPCGGREWLIHPNDVCVAELPDQVVDLLIREAGYRPAATYVDVPPRLASSIDAANLSNATRRVLANGAPQESGWNDAIFRAACDLCGCGVPLSDAEPALLAAACSWNTAEERKALATIRSAYNHDRRPARPPRLATVKRHRRRHGQHAPNAAKYGLKPAVMHIGEGTA